MKIWDCLFITETNYVQNKIPVENINISFENNKFFLSFDEVKKKLTWQIFLWLVWNSQRELFNKNEWLGCPWKAARISNLRGKILKFLYLEVKFVKTKLQMKSNLLYLNDFLKNWKILNWFYINNILKWSLTTFNNLLLYLQHAKEWMFSPTPYPTSVFITKFLLFYFWYVLSC